MENLKVQLLVGGKSIDKPSFRDNYVNYLQAIALNFSSNTTLYSYDFYNEPLYFDNNEYSKSEICTLVESWYFAIKNNSLNHLTTIGLATSTETFEWDPGILKLDFLSFHLYSDNINIVKSEIKWIAETCNIPWMIGETGYSASTTGSGGQGSLQEQKDFAKMTLEMARDCGAIGYSWWMYQDVYWGDPNMGDYLGLIDHQNILKPAVVEFQTFEPFNYGQSCSTPSNYYNYDNNNNYNVSGIVKDQFNNPIKNAVIIGWAPNWRKSVKTYSDSNGFFTLYSDSTIGIVYATAIGSNVYKNYNVSGQLNITLNQFKPVYDLHKYSVIIQQNQNLTYEASNSIILNDFIIIGNGSTGGNLISKATQKIILKTGFKAQKGSFFKAENSSIYYDCDYGNNYNISQTTNYQFKAQKKNEELQLLLDENNSINNKYTISVFPNPSNGIFYIRNNDKIDIEIVEIFNNLGQLIYRNDDINTINTINISEKSKGKYLLKLIKNGQAYFYNIFYD